MRQLVYTMFITSNHASFHLWWKQNLVKYQKVSKYYVCDRLQNFVLLSMFLLTALIVKNSLILAGFYFIFLKPSWTKLESLWIPNLDLSEKIGKVVIEVRQNLALFRNLVSLILSWNCVKRLIVTKLVQKINFEGTWGKLKAKNCFQRQSWTKYMIQTLVFLWNSLIQESFSFYFSAVFC